LKKRRIIRTAEVIIETEEIFLVRVSGPGAPSQASTAPPANSKAKWPFRSKLLKSPPPASEPRT
jgi:hypothetical protein